MVGGHPNLPSTTFEITGSANYSGSGTALAQINVPAPTYAITFGVVVDYVTPASQTRIPISSAVIIKISTYFAPPSPTHSQWQHR